MFHFALEGGVLVVTHYEKTFHGLNFHLPGREIQAPEFAPSFLVQVGDTKFLLPGRVLLDAGVNRFKLGNEVTKVKIKPLSGEASEFELINQRRPMIIEGEPGETSFKLDPESLPHIPVTLTTSQGEVEQALPVLIPIVKYEYSEKLHDTAEIPYSPPSENLPSGTFQFTLDGNRLHVVHVTNPGFGFISTHQVEPAPYAVEFFIQFGAMKFYLNSTDLLLHGKVTYLLPEAPVTATIGLSDRLEAPYDVNYWQLYLRNQNTTNSSDQSSKNEAPIQNPAPELVQVYNTGAIETTLLNPKAKAKEVLAFPYEYPSRIKQFGTFEFRIVGQSIVVTHFAKNSHAMAPAQLSSPGFKLELLIYLGDQALAATLEKKDYDSGKVEIPLPDNYNGDVEILVQPGLTKALFEKSAGRLLSNSCSGSFGP